MKYYLIQILLIIIIIQSVRVINQFYLIFIKGNSEFGEYDKVNKKIKKKKLIISLMIV